MDEYNLNWDLVQSHSFEEQAEIIWKAVRLASRDIDDIRTPLNDIREILQDIWPGCHTKIFGSLVTALAFKDSDVDVMVDLPSHSKDDPYECLIKIMVHIAYVRTGFEYVSSAPLARVPVITLNHVKCNRNCDITFTGPIAVEASKLVKFLLRVDRRAFKLAVLIKYWSKHYKLTATKRLSNYAVTLLLIFFLQQKKILPSVRALQKNVPFTDTEGWNTAFNDVLHYECHNEESLYELLGEFFLYYSNFNYEEFVVCTYLGYPVKKQTFNKTLRLRSGKELFLLTSCFCVQDPFEHSKNCTIDVNVELFRKIYMSFNIAAKCYNNYPSNKFLKNLVLKGCNMRPTERYELNRFRQYTITNGQVPQEGRSWKFYFCTATCFLTLYYYIFLSPRIGA